MESIFALADDEKAAILSMPMQVATLRADQDVVRVGDSPSRSCIILEGMTATYVSTSKGRRQIVSFGIMGDTPDLQSLLLEEMDNSLSTLTPCTLGFVQHAVLRDVCTRFPRIAAALWRSTLVDAAIFRAWMTSIGQREGYSRMAHLFCELVARKRAVGLVEEDRCAFPITQTELADALGMTAVHVNRVLQALRSDGHIVLDQGWLTVPDWDRLVAVADFDATYLHVKENRPAA
nr:Crp/Fnr family transcriptional regulator [Chthonobacter rhizosphaerae]